MSADWAYKIAPTVFSLTRPMRVNCLAAIMSLMFAPRYKKQNIVSNRGVCDSII